MSKTYTPGELQQFLVPPEKWGACPYPGFVEVVTEQQRDGNSVGLSCTPEGRWYIVLTGKGPRVLWEEADELP